ncbi:MAG TPA: ABC transporter substrate-binding protein, partial [Solirubrobacteraceae bacterium]|nr:ABC transporter substrate-binding protein [Solirubrobacteraceae bacterium]
MAWAETPATTPLVRFPFPQEDGSLTPYTFEIGYPLVTLIYDTLLWRDSRGVPRPWLASSVQTDPGGRQVTIRLRRGVRWHDGVPLTAADVAFTYRFMADRPHPRFTPQLRDVQRVDATDDSTVTFTLRRPSIGFLDQPLADVPILPRHLWQGLRRGELAPAGPPVGSGPYRLVDHRPGASYRFQAHASYFRGRPRVSRLEVPIIREADRTIRALERRKVDMIPVGLTEDDGDRLERLFGVRVVKGESYLGITLMLNLRRPPFDRPEVRRAVGAALDLVRLSRTAGQAQPAERGFLHPASRWSSPTVLQQTDEAAAQVTLADPRLPAIQVLAPDNDPVKREAGRQVVIALERAGAQARLRPLSADAFFGAIGGDGSPPNYTAAIASIPPLASHDPDFLHTLFGSKPRARLNYTGYRSTTFDRLAKQVATAPSRAQRQAAVDRQLQLLASDLPSVPLFFTDGAFAYRPAIFDGWIFVKGTGILDKRSFLRGERAEAGPTPSGDPVDPATDLKTTAIGPLGWIAIA